MKVIVMGCGRMGEKTARMLSAEGHEVVVIDADPNLLAHLGPEYPGRKVHGIGFDRSVLIEAGIESADAFVATSSSDNGNIVAARIARDIFHIPRVVARFLHVVRYCCRRAYGRADCASWHCGIMSKCSKPYTRGTQTRY